MRRNLSLAATSAVALLLAACQFNATTRLDASGGGEFRSEVGFSAAERQSMEEQAGEANADNFCNIPAEQGQAPSDVTVTEEVRGDETWCVTATHFDDLDELRALYERNEAISVNRLEISGGRLYYDVSINLNREDGSGFANYESANWQVVVPGDVVSHNADEAQSNTLRWTLEPNSGVANLQAESTVPNSGPSILLIGLASAALAAVVLLALAGGAMWLKARGR